MKRRDFFSKVGILVFGLLGSFIPKVRSNKISQYPFHYEVSKYQDDVFKVIDMGNDYQCSINETIALKLDIEGLYQKAGKNVKVEIVEIT